MMARRDIRRLLQSWGKADAEIDALEDQLKTIADEIDAVGDLHAQNLDGMPHSTEIGRPTEASVLRRIGLAERYQDRVAEITDKIRALEEFKDKVERALLWTSPDEEYVIRMKYVGHLEKMEGSPLTFAKIAELMDLTERRVKQIELSAITTIAEKIEM